MGDDTVQGVAALAPGQHLCGLYCRPQDCLASVEYLRQGLSRGDRLVCVASPQAAAALVSALASACGLSSADLRGKGSPTLISAARPRDLPLADALDRLLLRLRDTLAEPSPSSAGLRVLVQLPRSWLTAPVSDLARFETGLDDLLQQFCATGLCLYPLNSLSAEQALRLLAAHPFVLLGDQVLPDRYFLSEPPAESADQPPALVDGPASAPALETFPELNPNPVLEVTEVGRITYLNPAAQRLFPDLPAREVGHPFLTDWEHAMGHLRRESSASIRREVSVGPRSYLQSIRRVPGADRVQLYGFDVTIHQEVRESLARSESLLRTVVSSSPLGLLVVDAQTNQVLCCNRRFFEIWRMDAVPREVTAPQCGSRITEHILSQISDPALAAGGCCLNSPPDLASSEVSDEVPLKDGRFLHRLCSHITDGDGHAFARLCIFEDITDLKRVERALRVLSECNQVIVKATDEDTLLKDICRLLVEEGSYLRAWIGFAEDGHCVRPVAHCGVGAEGLQGVEVRWDESELGRGPTGRALRTGQTQVCGDLEHESDFAPWREPARRLGLRSAAVLSLRADRGVLGCLAVYSGRRDAFSGEELALLQELAGDLAYGIAGLRLRARLREALADLREANETLEQKVAERTGALAQSERQYRELVDLAASAIVRVNPEGRITFFNEAAERIFGWRSEEVLSRHLLDTILPPADAAGRDMGAMIEDLLRTPGRHLRNENENLTKDGRRLWIAWSNTVLHDHDGNPLGLISVGQDITEQKLAREALQRREAILSAINFAAESFLQAGTWKDHLPEVLQRLAQATDSTRVALLQNYWDEHGALRVRHYCEWADPSHPHREGRRLPGDFSWQERGLGTWCRILERDEAIVTTVQDLPPPERELLQETGLLSLALLPIFADDGWWGVLVFDDFRADREWTPSELEALHAAADLLAVGIERELAVHTLHDTLRELERSNQELEQFAYIASHDLREPLRTVMSYVQLLEEEFGDMLGEEAREYVQFAVQGARRMDRLVQDLLAYSRVATQQQTLAWVPLEVPLRSAMENLERTIAETTAQITWDPLPVVRGDVSQLTQLFQNLLSNALKFHSETPPEIYISGRRDGSEVVVSVTDNGIGFHPADSERIFAIFQRLHTQDRYPGTGIGLPLCKSIIERHGGRIWVESQPGSGATFCFALPGRGGPKP